MQPTNQISLHKIESTSTANEIPTGAIPTGNILGRSVSPAPNYPESSGRSERRVSQQILGNFSPSEEKEKNVARKIDPGLRYQQDKQTIDQQMEQSISGFNIESCYWQNNNLNVIPNPPRSHLAKIRIKGPSDPSVIQLASRTPHHLIYGLSIDLKKPFFSLIIATNRMESLISGSIENRQNKLMEFIRESICSGIVNTRLLSETHAFFDDLDLENLRLICEFLFNIMNPKAGQTICSLRRDIWLQATPLVGKLESYAERTRSFDVYYLFRCFKFDIEQLHKLIP